MIADHTGDPPQRLLSAKGKPRGGVPEGWRVIAHGHFGIFPGPSPAGFPTLPSPRIILPPDDLSEQSALLHLRSHGQ
jgi:hypothetical protein